MNYKSTSIVWLTGFILLGFSKYCPAQEWPFEVIKSDLVGAWIRAADFDNDNDPDLLVQNGDTLFWYENLRPGWTEHRIDSQFLGSELAWINIFDMDSDGDMDILQAASNESGTVAWNENRMNGMVWVKHFIGTNIVNPGNTPSSYGDIDKDNDLDIIVPSFQNGSVFWFENTIGDTVWSQHEIAKFNDVIWSSVADIDGDTDLDIVVGDYFSGDIHWIENQLPDSTWPIHPIANLFGDAFGECFDIDQDGDQDVVTHSNQSNVLVYYENPAWNMVTILSGVDNLIMGVIGDMDGDMDMDVTYGGRSEIGWVENHHGSWVQHIIGSGSFPIPTDNADIDGDTDMDVVASTYDFSTNLGDGRWYVNSTITAIDNGKDRLPTNFTLFQNYPNPFNPATIIRYQLPEVSNIELTIYDLLGTQIKTLVKQKQPVGTYQVEWDGRNEEGAQVSSGVYIYGLTADSYSQTKKMVLLR